MSRDRSRIACLVVPALAALLAASAAPARSILRPPEPAPTFTRGEVPLPAIPEDRGETPTSFAGRGADVLDPIIPSEQGNRIDVRVLSHDRWLLEGRHVDPEDLAAGLARLADTDRDEETPNRVSLRVLHITAPPSTRWRAVFRVVRMAARPGVRIHRILLAEEGGRPVRLSIPPEWIPAEKPDRMLVRLEPTIEVELKRRPDESVSGIKLLDAWLGSGAEGLRLLGKCVRQIRENVDNRACPASIHAWPAVPLSVVLQTAGLLWSEGCPEVRLTELVPDMGPPEVVEARLDLMESMRALSLAEQCAFLVNSLWSENVHVVWAAEAMLDEERIWGEAGRAIPLILERLGERGPPRKSPDRSDACRCCSASPLDRVIASFGEDSIPALLHAIGSRNADVRRVAALALGRFPSRPPEVQEALDRLLQDPSGEVRSAAAVRVHSVED